MGKKKSGGGRLKKKNLEQMVIALFEENPTQVYELKTLYRELHLNTHPAKMLILRNSPVSATRSTTPLR